MENFPTICVDNFYKDPDAIRNYALNLPYDNPEDKEGRYPGKRTRLLHELDPTFFKDSCEKIFSLLYDYTTVEVDWIVASSFQLVEPYGEIGSPRNLGWIHPDKDSVLAGVIYLTPNSNLDTGTSIFKLKEGRTSPLGDEKWLKIKENFYTKKDDTNFDQLIQEHNSNFEETIRYNNVYNRLIMFDATLPHAATNYYTGTETRLTQLFFVKSIISKSLPPIHRCMKHNL